MVMWQLNTYHIRRKIRVDFVRTKIKWHIHNPKTASNENQEPEVQTGSQLCIFRLATCKLNLRFWFPKRVVLSPEMEREAKWNEINHFSNTLCKRCKMQKRAFQQVQEEFLDFRQFWLQFRELPFLSNAKVSVVNFDEIMAVYSHQYNNIGKASKGLRLASLLSRSMNNSSFGSIFDADECSVG